MCQSLIWEKVEAALREQPQSCLRKEGTGGERIPYGRLLPLVSRAASHLRQLLDSQQHGTGLLKPDACSEADAHVCGGPEVPLVGLFMEQSLHYICAVLACLAAGCAFLPLNPSWPHAHLHSILRTAQPLAVLFDGHISSSLDDQQMRLAKCGAAAIDVVQLLSQEGGQGQGSEGRGCQQDEPQMPQLQQQRQQQQQQQLSAQQEFNCNEQQQQQQQLGLHQTCRNLPYFCVMFTSGSTGQPAGVCCTEAGLLNRCLWMDNEYPFLQGDLVAAKTAPCFVDSLWEIFGPLLAGASVLVLRRSTVLQPSLMAQALIREGATHFVAVPSVLCLMLPMLRTLSMSGPKSLDPCHLSRCRLAWEDSEAANHESSTYAASGIATPKPAVVPGEWQEQQCSLRHVVSSGEPLSWQLCEQLKEALPSHCTLLNLYGSTEVAADCACFNTCQLQPLLQHLVLQQQHLHHQHHQHYQYHQHQHQHPHPHTHFALPSVPAGRPISNTAVLITPLQPSPLTPTVLLPQHLTVSNETSRSYCQTHPLPLDSTDKAPAPGAKQSTSTSPADACCQSMRCSACQVHPLPLNMAGEVLVGGAGVAAGYISPTAAAVAQPISEIHPTSASAAAGSRRNSKLEQAGCAPKSAAHEQADGMHNTAALAAQARFPQLWVHADALHHVAVSSGPQRHSSSEGLLHSASCPGLEERLCSREGLRFFRTGDLGYLIEDEAGQKQLVVVGRLDYQVKIDGVRVDLLAVEAVLQQHPMVEEAAMVAVHEGNHGDGHEALASAPAESPEPAVPSAGASEGALAGTIPAACLTLFAFIVPAPQTQSVAGTSAEHPHPSAPAAAAAAASTVYTPTILNEQQGSPTSGPNAPAPLSQEAGNEHLLASKQPMPPQCLDPTVTPPSTATAAFPQTATRAAAPPATAAATPPTEATTGAAAALQLSPCPRALQLQLRDFLAARLPSHACLPHHFAILQQPLPRSPAYKVLRPLLARAAAQQLQQHRNLAAITQKQQQQQEQQRNDLAATQQQQQQQPLQQQGQVRTPSPWPLPPSSELQIMSAFVSVLGPLAAHGLEPTDDFFAAGGTSMMAAELAGILGIELRLLLAAPTVRRLAPLLSTQSLHVTTAMTDGDVTRGEGLEGPPTKRSRPSGRHSPPAQPLLHSPPITSIGSLPASQVHPGDNAAPGQAPSVVDALTSGRAAVANGTAAGEAAAMGSHHRLSHTLPLHNFPPHAPPSQPLSIPPPSLHHLPAHALAAALQHATCAVVQSAGGRCRHVLPRSDPRLQAQQQHSLHHQQQQQHQEQQHQQQQQQPLHRCQEEQQQPPAQHAHDHSYLQSQNGGRSANLKVAWRRRMGRCIDAAPILITLHSSCPSSQAFAQSSSLALAQSSSQVLAQSSLPALPQSIGSSSDFSIAGSMHACCTRNSAVQGVDGGSQSHGDVEGHRQPESSMRGDDHAVQGSMHCADHAVQGSMPPWGGSHGVDRAVPDSMHRVDHAAPSSIHGSDHAMLNSFVLACSHDGDVGCFEASSGACVWHRELPARAEAGLEVTPDLRHVVVACADGLHCLCLATGEPAGTRQQQQLQQMQQTQMQKQQQTTQQQQQQTQQPPPEDNFFNSSGGAHTEVAAHLGGEPQAVDLGGNPKAVDLGGEPKAAPAADLWGSGCVWATSHGKQLVVVQPPYRVLARAPLPAACSVPPVFSSHPHRQVHVACLNGTVSAWQVKFNTSTAPMHPSHLGGTERTRSGWDAKFGIVRGNCGAENSSRGTAGGGGKGMGTHGVSQSATGVELPDHAKQQQEWSPCQPTTGVELRPVWRAQPHPKSAPIFSTPAVDEAAEVLVVAHVDGLCFGLSLVDGHVVWSRDLQAGLVFAPLSLCPPCLRSRSTETHPRTPPAEHPRPHTASSMHRSQCQSITAATVSDHALSSTNFGAQLPPHTCSSVQTPQHGDAADLAQDMRSPRGVIVATHGGRVLWLCSMSGRIGWQVQVAPSGGSPADRRISAAPAWLLLVHSSSSSSASANTSTPAPTAVAPPEHAGSSFDTCLVSVVSSSGLLTLIRVCHHVGMTSTPPEGAPNTDADLPGLQNEASRGDSSYSGEACVVSRTMLPSEVFSSPVLLQQGVCVSCFMGCRDDHLYRLDIAMQR